MYRVKAGSFTADGVTRRRGEAFESDVDYARLYPEKVEYFREGEPAEEEVVVEEEAPPKPSPFRRPQS